MYCIVFIVLYIYITLIEVTAYKFYLGVGASLYLYDGIDAVLGELEPVHVTIDDGEIVESVELLMEEVSLVGGSLAVRVR